jgi:RES domain
MIGFRQCDARCPLLWEGTAQPEGRWHGADEGPAHYFADTPDGAWAEFLRHEEIRDPADLATIRRAIWVVDLGDAPAIAPSLPHEMMCGNRSTFAACQAAARDLRAAGHQRLDVPTAALRPGHAAGHHVTANTASAPHARDGRTLVVFGEPADLNLVGWPVAVDAAPPRELLSRVRHFTADDRP